MATATVSLNVTVGLVSEDRIIRFSSFLDLLCSWFSGRQVNGLSLSNNQSAKLDMADAMVEVRVRVFKTVCRYAVVSVQGILVNLGKR